ncbi:coenzyme PQQ biosynthesis probable peptidase PqqF [Pseudomonas nitritireducens]|uniref:Coenzyme PQQ biosynthesis probable peptidase PqqF n=1 Tax=Pseudomonas nitroreducens TaxID=46680 RepID=A0A7W7KQY6_PSENT|nr:pyrroloquinoline quinone biosynthesis protein PqqF [Pseudomonas nitritireducens]MBB4867046.1 coenzyme PQQ biosynthesis probable peptidase PqqF [Pseudomonas nitritireducens]
MKTFPTQQLTLANGLRATLVHSPGASRAAALLRIARGSHDEPVEHPGLAHFIEHLLFLCGERFTEAERLMPWVQAHGGRVNASTRARHTDYFFEVPAQALGAGLARLVDMLARPRLDEATQLAEREVLEAEFLARGRDPDTLVDAALALAIAPGHELARFVAGRRDSLAVESAVFQQALRDFIHACQLGGRLELWLQGPQSLAELAALAEREAAVFPAGAPAAGSAHDSLLALTGEELKLRLPGVPRLVLAFALDGVDGEAGTPLDPLQGWLADEAPGSLLAHLGQNGLCDSARLRLSRLGNGQALLRFDFELAQAAAAEPLEAAFLGWLDALRQLPDEDFAAAPGEQPRGVLEQLQRLARPRQTSSWLDQLVARRMIRLLACEALIGESLTCAGFVLDVVRSPAQSLQPLAGQPWCFAPARPAEAGERAALHLRWRFAQAPGRQAFLAARQALRPLAGAARREGASLHLEAFDSDWCLLLSGPQGALDTLAGQALAVLHQPPATVLGQGARLLEAEGRRRAGDLPIRQLLDLLPQALAGDNEAAPDWSAAHWDALCMNAELPGAIPGASAATALPSRSGPPGRHRQVLEIPGEAALLLFCPLATRSAEDEAAWRLLARVLEPAFYHWLRGERQLAYALYCGFRQIGGRRGLLFAVQSPLLSAVELQAEVDSFLYRQGEALGRFDPQRLDSLRAALVAELAQRPEDFSGRLQQAWEDQLAGVDQDQRSTLAAALAGVDLTQLRAAHSQLASTQGGHWLLLSHA